MVKLYDGGVYLVGGRKIAADAAEAARWYRKAADQ